MSLTNHVAKADNDKPLPIMTAKKMLIIVGLFVFVGSIALAQEYTYIGAAKCKMCHKGRYSDKGI